MEESQQDSVDNSISVTRHKIILVGDAGVGKTAIINRIVNNEFSDVYEMSIGVDFVSKNIRYRGQNIKLQIWDTAGQEKYKGLIPSYIRNSSIVFVVYDISSKNSFNHIPSWINFIKSIENSTIILCGNKSDLVTREVEKNEGEEYAKKEGFQFFEVSAKADENVKLMFYTAVANLPSFFEGETIKENLIKELLEENGVENIQEGSNVQISDQEKGNTMNVNGKTEIVVNQNKKGCGC